MSDNENKVNELNEALKGMWDSLTDEQKEKAKECKSMDELMALAGKMRIELPDELLETVAGGFWFGHDSWHTSTLRENNDECNNCEWFGRCGGGCRALAILHGITQGITPDYFGCDPLACLFYKGGWYDKVQESLKEYKHF